MTGRPTSAMIFAAGLGTRMGALVQDRPKPMIPLLGRPMIDHTIDLVRAAGIDHVVVNTHFKHDIIAPHLSAQGLKISHEATLLDTGGGLKAALPLLGKGPILTINSDAAWTGRNPVTELMDAWDNSQEALLLVQPMERSTARREAGDFALTNGQITRKGPFVYTGAQIIDPTRIADAEAEIFSFNAVWDDLIATTGLPGIVHDGGWCDIGHPDGLLAAERLLRDG